MSLRILLLSNTTYEIDIAAVNEVGIGNFNGKLLVQTLAEGQKHILTFHAVYAIFSKYFMQVLRKKHAI